MNNKLKSALLVLVAGIAISGCGGGASSSGGTSGSGGNTVQGTASPLTIDAAGTVPVFGSSSTSSLVYVHNNTDQTISGIAYGAQINTGTSSTSNIFLKMLNSAQQLLGIKAGNIGGFLDQNGAGLCQSIPAGQSCPLIFHTPIISKETSQGSALITAYYNLDNKAHTFSQVISYALVSQNNANGAVFNSNALIHGYGNSVGYATVYLYGSGSDRLYTVTGMSTNKPGVTITQGNITGRQIQSTYVQAVEVSAQTANANLGYSVALTASSIDAFTSTGFSPSVTMLAVPGSPAGAILTSGTVPLINSAVPNPTGSLFVVNSGTTTTSISPVGSGGVTVTGNSCSSNIAAGGNCTINFTVPQQGNTGSISIPFTNASPTSASPLVQSVIWYNSKGADLLSMVSNANPIVFNASESGLATITSQNIGGFDMNTMTAPAPQIQSGTGTATSTAPVCSGTPNTTLPVQGTCTFDIRVAAAESTAGTVQAYISGLYDNGSTVTYRRALNLTYLASAFAPSLSITPNPVTMTVVGDNVSVTTQTLTVTNNGPAPAVIESSLLISNPAFLSIESNGCLGQTLESFGGVNKTCSVVVKLGSTQSPIAESGTSTYKVQYSGGTIPAQSGANATAPINWTVTPDTQNLTMFSALPSNATGGIGESVASQILFSGANPTGQLITLTYKNSGTESISITGITNTNSPISWTLDTVNSTCNTFPNVLLPNATCTVIFNNALINTILAATGNPGFTTGVYNINLTVPTITFTHLDAQFIDQPLTPFPTPGTVIYAQENLATIANSESMSAGPTLKITHTLANATGYSAIPVTSKFESYYSSYAASSGCSVSSAIGVVTQLCNLTQSGGIAVESVSYAVESSYTGKSLAFTILYSESGSQVAGMNKLYAIVPIP